MKTTTRSNTKVQKNPQNKDGKTPMAGRKREKAMIKWTFQIKAGDMVEVGRFRNVRAEVKSIEFDDKGQPEIVTSKGRKKLFSCRLVKLMKKA